jgi:hypothetical protein
MRACEVCGGEIPAEKRRGTKFCSRECIGARYRETNRREIAEEKRQYAKGNRQRMLDAQQRYYEANREKVNERRRQRWKRDREKNIERKRRYREANRAECNDQQRRYLDKLSIEAIDMLNQIKETQS